MPEQGWTDGLPIVPPTAAQVAACLEAAHLAPGEVIGVERVRQRRLLAEKVAVNTVMAGCRPAYMPVVVAILRAMCQEPFNLHGSTASTGGTAQFIVVNGPIRTALGMNATHNVLANGNRANATIGRAVRLVLINLLGVIPGQLDRSTLGHPGKYTFCIAEDEDDSPWTPLAQLRGVPAGRSAVTVLACESPRQLMNEWTHDPEDILATFAADMRHNMLTYSVWSGNYAMVIPKQLRDLIAAAGWQKQDIQEFIFRHTRLLRHEWATVGKRTIVDRGGGPQIPRSKRPWPPVTGPPVCRPWRDGRSDYSTMASSGSMSCSITWKPFCVRSTAWPRWYASRSLMPAVPCPPRCWRRCMRATRSFRVWVIEAAAPRVVYTMR